MAQQQYQTSPIEHISSPTLEALYQDLDMFISELSVNSASAPDYTNNNDITPLELNKPLVYNNNKEEGNQNQYNRYPPQTFDNLMTPPAQPPQPPIHKSNSISTVSSTNSSSPPKIIHTPPMSPSALRIGSSDYFPKEDYLPSTRSSSLHRSYSSPTKSSVHFAPLNLPTSPLAFEIKSLQDSIPFSEDGFPNHAFLSYMSQQLIKQVKALNEQRKLYCSVEYPLSFYGEEIMDIIRNFSPPGLSDSIYLEIAQCFLNCTPKLVKPIDSSEKSLRRNKIYDSSTEVYTLIEEAMDQEIQGIYTPLTRCYSSSCLPGHPGCYSPSCPNRIYALNGYIFKTPAKSLMSTSSHDTTLSRAWSATVARDILKSMPESEIKRQEAIHEIIYTEDDYVRDLKILDLDFAKELLSSQCIEEDRKKEFHDRILNNYQEILEIHDALYQDLRDHQAICQATSGIGLVDQIGDIFLRHVPKFLDAYLRYGPHVVLAEYEAKKEAERNMLFKHFIKARESLPQCRRLPFRHFIILPVTRLQRYALLLGAILKKTPDDNPDKQWIAQCMEQIKDVAERVDAGTSQTKNTLRIWEINDRIRQKADSEPHQLDLMEPGRRLLKEGVMSRKLHMNVETIELQVFLFDHMLLMTKPRKSSTMKDDVEYHISKKPIPLSMLQVQDASEGFSLRTMTRDYMPSPNATPLFVSHLGRNGQDFILYPENAQDRMEWKEKIEKAKEAYDAAATHVFDIKTLSDTKFANAGTSGPNNHGKVTCTVPFRGPGGVRMLVIGTQQGVWIGVEGNSHSIQLVLTMADITQMQVLQDHFILMILADKTLYAYALEPLLSPQALAVKKGVADRQFQKIAQSITYFHSGVCNGRTLVIAMKKKGVDSHFKVFEPVCGDLREAKNKSKFFSKSGLFSKTTPWFRSTLEFYIGTESYAMHFLKARVVVVCARGFEIVNLEALNMNRNLPDMNNPDFGFIQQRGSDLRPLGMFRCEENYLLCYDAFAFMVNVHGAFVKDRPLIEWEGVPQSVAFWFPYVIGFDARFIEVRHVETGELVQIISGANMRSLHLMNALGVPEYHGCMTHPFKPDFQYIFQIVSSSSL